MTTPKHLADDIHATFLRIGLGKVISDKELQREFDELEGPGALHIYLNECGKQLDELLSMFSDRFVRCGPNRWKAYTDGAQQEILNVMAGPKKGSKGGRGGGGGFGGRGRGSGFARGNNHNNISRTLHSGSSFKHTVAPHRGGMQNSRPSTGSYGAAFRNHQQHQQPPPPQNNQSNMRPLQRPTSERRDYFGPNGYADSGPSGPSRSSDYPRGDDTNRSYSNIDDRGYNASRGFFDNSAYDEHSQRRRERTPSPPRRPYSPEQDRRFRESPPRYNDYNASSNRSVRHSPDRRSFRERSPSPYRNLHGPGQSSSNSKIAEPPGAYDARQRSPPRLNRNEDEEVYTRPRRTPKTPNPARPDSPSSISGFSVSSEDSSPPRSVANARGRSTARNDELSLFTGQELAQRFNGSVRIANSPPPSSSFSNNELSANLAEACFQAAQNNSQTSNFLPNFFSRVEDLTGKEFPGSKGVGKRKHLQLLIEAFPAILASLTIEDNYVKLRPPAPRVVPQTQKPPTPSAPAPHYLNNYYTEQKPVRTDTPLFQMIRQHVIFMEQREFDLEEELFQIMETTCFPQSEVLENLTFVLFYYYKGKYRYVGEDKRRVGLSPRTDRPGVPNFFRASQQHRLLRNPERARRVRVVIPLITKFDKFSARLYDDLADYEEMDRSIQDYFEDHSNSRAHRVTPTDFRVGHACIIRKDVFMGKEKFHRAVVIKVGSDIRVYLLDVGKVEEPNPDEMYSMPAKYESTPPFAFCCSLNADTREANALFKRWKRPLQQNSMEAVYVELLPNKIIDSKDGESKVAKVNMFVQTYNKLRNIVDLDDN